MRKSGIFICILIFLSGYANFIEILKLPALVSHYLSHQIDAPQANFFEFLHDHYCAEHFHCDQRDPHEDLPFQHADFHPVVVDAHASSDGLSKVYVFIEKCPQNAHFDNPFVKGVALDFWQPPKLSFKS
jgi:hypothetical protein